MTPPKSDSPTSGGSSTACFLEQFNSIVRPDGPYESALSVVAKTTLIALGVWGMHRMLLRNRTLPTRLAHVVKVVIPTLAVLAVDRIIAEYFLTEKKIKPADDPNVAKAEITKTQLDAATQRAETAETKLAKLNSAAELLVKELKNSKNVDPATLDKVQQALLVASSDAGVIAWIKSWFPSKS